MIGFHWIGRRWVEFVRGYSGYLTFILNFGTFVTVLYGLAPYVSETVKFPFFVGMIVMIVLPLAVLIGHIHFKKQYPIEQEVGLTKSPYTYKIVPKSKELISYRNQIAIMEHMIAVETNDARRENLKKAVAQAKGLIAGHDSRDIL